MKYTVELTSTMVFEAIEADSPEEAKAMVLEETCRAEWTAKVTRNSALECRKCGTELDADGFCQDETCPHSDWRQHVKVTDLHVLSAEEVEEKYDTFKRRPGRIMAEFNPQAWIRDNALDVDAEGDTTFDVTPEVLAMGRKEALAMEDNQIETDHLRYAEAAPAWIREWGGPFYIRVENAIQDYLAGQGAEK